jgi:hypothetical protein
VRFKRGGERFSTVKAHRHGIILIFLFQAARNVAGEFVIVLNQQKPHDQSQIPAYGNL